MTKQANSMSRLKTPLPRYINFSKWSHLLFHTDTLVSKLLYDSYSMNFILANSWWNFRLCRGSNWSLFNATWSSFQRRRIFQGKIYSCSWFHWRKIVQRSTSSMHWWKLLCWRYRPSGIFCIADCSIKIVLSAGNLVQNMLISLIVVQHNWHILIGQKKC